MLGSVAPCKHLKVQDWDSVGLADERFLEFLVNTTQFVHAAASIVASMLTSFVWSSGRVCDGSVSGRWSPGGTYRFRSVQSPNL